VKIESRNELMWKGRKEHFFQRERGAILEGVRSELTKKM